LNQHIKARSPGQARHDRRKGGSKWPESARVVRKPTRADFGEAKPKLQLPILGTVPVDRVLASHHTPVSHRRPQRTARILGDYFKPREWRRKVPDFGFPDLLIFNYG